METGRQKRRSMGRKMIQSEILAALASGLTPDKLSLTRDELAGRCRRHPWPSIANALTTLVSKGHVMRLPDGTVSLTLVQRLAQLAPVILLPPEEGSDGPVHDGQ